MTAILSWLLFGLLAGASRAWSSAAVNRSDVLATIAVGMVGALIGGLIGEVVFGEDDARFRWDLAPFLLAVGGAIVLLLALEALGGGGRRRWHR